jgi:FKBP-type peptidyl-prolyl cis-trans isomerase (trigger factor)
MQSLLISKDGKRKMKHTKKIFAAIVALILAVGLMACGANFNFDIGDYIDMADFRAFVINQSEINERISEELEALIRQHTRREIPNRNIEADDEVNIRVFPVRDFVNITERGVADGDWTIIDFAGVTDFEAQTRAIASNDHLYISYRVIVEGIDSFDGDRAEFLVITVPPTDAAQATTGFGAFGILSELLERVPEFDESFTIEFEIPETFAIYEDAAGLAATMELTIHHHFTGEFFPGGAESNFFLEIGAGQFIDGFEEAMHGQSVGELRPLHIAFPEEYPQSPELAGRDVTFFVTLHKAFTGTQVAYRSTLVPGNPEALTFVVGSETLVPGLEESLIGRGFEADSRLYYATVTFPEDYARGVAGPVGSLGRALRDQEITFVTIIASYVELFRPELTDEFISDNTGFDTYEELNYELNRLIRANLAFDYIMENSIVTDFPQRELRAEYRAIFQRQIDAIVVGSHGELPLFLMGIQSLDDFAAHNNVQGGREALEAINAINAGRTVKEAMVILYIARAENIEISRSEFNERLETLILEQYEAAKQRHHETQPTLFMSFREFNRNFRREHDHTEIERWFLFDDVRDWMIENITVYNDVT